MANVSTQVAASKPSSMIERIRKDLPLDADAGTVPQGALVGRNAAGYFVNAADSVALTEVGLNLSVTQVANAALADGISVVDVEQGVVVPLKIATLSTAAAARKAYGRCVSALYNDEVQLGPGSYQNWVGVIVGHNSVTEVLVEVRQLTEAEKFGEAQVTREIWVDSLFGDDTKGRGSRTSPMKTIEAAWALLTATRNQLNILPGDYTTAAVCALPAFSIYVNGVGPNGSVTIGPDAAHVVLTTPMFSKAAGALTATAYYSWENVTIDHGDVCVGIQIDNTTAGKKIILAGRNVEMGGSARSINVLTHGDASNAVRIHWNNGGMEIEGAVYFAVGNDGDQVRFNDTILSGGLSSNTSATVMEFTLRNCEVLYHSITGGATQQVFNAIHCHSRNGATLALFDTTDLAGSHTENIIGS